MKLCNTLAGRLIASITFFIVLSLICFNNNIARNKLRKPANDYISVEEEYIASIDHFLKSGELIVPQDATFHYDGDTIIITDNKTTAKETCTFILDSRIPIYEWYYDSFENTDFIYNVIALIIISTILYFSLLIYSKFIYPFYQNGKTLNDLKSNANFGDNRNVFNNKKANCMECDKVLHCKCIQCMYLGKCGNCPASDCEDAFEEFMYDIRNQENGNIENDICFAHETSKQESFEDKCITCDYFEKCTECPSEDCIQKFEVNNPNPILDVVAFEDDEPESFNI